MKHSKIVSSYSEYVFEKWKHQS